MYHQYQQRLNQLEREGLSRFLRGGYKGLEKESLRVSPNGFIAQTEHPQPLGAALTHPYITTDYAEALLEFVSPPYMDALEANQFLYQIHQFVFENLQHDEMLWATSMPCAVRGDESIHIARYGSSNAAQFKEVYRRGLGHRYGRIMQTIAGVHFNYSVPARFWPIYQFVEQNDERPSDFRTAVYMGLVRNVLRYDWLLFYLFGSSPAVCHTFLAGRDHPFERFDQYTLYKPYATTLRMSDIGYQNKLPPEFVVSLNSLTEYVAGLTYAIETPYPPYQEIGVQVEGEYRQLNDHFLQIENEYYSAMRPKQSVHAGERPALALQRRGVAYVELRAIDVNPFTPTGVSPDQLHFLEMFLLFCLLLPSPPLDTAERQRLRANETAVALDGRRPGKLLQAPEGERSLVAWGAELLEQMRPLAEMLDGCGKGEEGMYTAVLSKLQERLADPEQTPSARILAEMRQEGESFHAFARRWSQQHEQTFRAAPLQGERRQFFQNLAAESHRAWEAQEAEPQQPFAQYLRDYFTRR